VCRRLVLNPHQTSIVLQTVHLTAFKIPTFSENHTYFIPTFSEKISLIYANFLSFVSGRPTDVDVPAKPFNLSQWQKDLALPRNILGHILIVDSSLSEEGTSKACYLCEMFFWDCWESIFQGDPHRGGNQHMCIRHTVVLYLQKEILPGQFKWRSIIHSITQSSITRQGWPISHWGFKDQQSKINHLQVWT